MQLRKAICGVVTGILLSGATALAKDVVNFENYREKSNYSVSRMVSFLGLNWLETQYELDGDGKADVLELRPIIGYEGEKVIVEEHPFLYYFDENKNARFDYYESLIDVEMDGLNQNEIRPESPEEKKVYGKIRI
ncbi:hypothetical protein GOV05_03515 [Candidatus Woesearchaeota archaeon]|nr:hypothetical protein [Candidatus Woesearchaeota archaeon]